MNSASFRGDDDYMDPIAAFSPIGDEVLVAIPRFQNTAGNAPGWGACGGILGE
jgi:hypothetical protein